MTRFFDVRSTVLVVVGHGLLAEEEDRPIAYELKRVIEERGRGDDTQGGAVVTDVWMLENEMAEFFPVIALGPPASNAFTAQIYEELPVVYTHDQRIFIQMDAEGDGKRVAVWGMDHEATREASRILVAEGFLDRFLEVVWRRSRG